MASLANPQRGATLARRPSGPRQVTRGRAVRAAKPSAACTTPLPRVLQGWPLSQTRQHPPGHRLPVTVDGPAPASSQNSGSGTHGALPTSCEAAGVWPAQGGEPKSRRVLLAVDDCDLSEQALQWVLGNLVRPGVDEIRLVHVVAGQRTEAAISTICTHSSDNLAGSITGSEEEDLEVVPLPTTALRETWAEQARSYLQRRFMTHLENLSCSFEVDLIKEYAPKSPAAIGHCICDAAETLDADVVVIAHGPQERHGPGKSDECKSTANFVAHYCHRPVVMLNQPCLDSYLARSTSQSGTPGAWQAQMQWTSSLTRARYPSVTELMGYEASRILLFAVDRRLEAAWAVDWAVKTMYRTGDEVHLVFVAGKKGSSPPKDLPGLESSLRDAGIATHMHIVSDEGMALPAHTGVGDALIRMCKELDARMLVLVNNSRDNLSDFLNHSITGHCTQQGSCATVVLHPPTEKDLYKVEAAYAP